MGCGWLTSMKRKRHQRAMNNLMRELNKNIKNDKLWKGRFYVQQIASLWYEYTDKSGADLWVVLCFYDKTTGANRIAADAVNHWRHFGGSKLWRQMNNFIIDDVLKEK